MREVGLPGLATPLLGASHPYPSMECQPHRPIIRASALLALAAAMWACTSSGTNSLPSDGLVALGTWGGDSAGLIVGDTAAHLHIACTFGDISGRVAIGADGRFSVAGSYMLRAYPVAYGPTLPAQFNGRLDGNTLTISVTVNDTVQHATVVRGPVSVRLGDLPQMANCPICVSPFDQAAMHRRIRR